MNTIVGQVVRSQSGFYTVQTGQGQLTCHLRGRLKQGRRRGDVLAVGDWVQVTPTDPAHGMVEAVEPRRLLFTRLAPDPRGDYRQILIANLDQVVMVFACATPAPRLGMLDRFLVVAERQGIPPLIVANKVDLVGLEQAQALFGHYQRIGYPVVFTAAASGMGIAGLRECLIGKLSLLTGPSGVGKTSLLNAIQPELGLAVREVSQVTAKGRHTTVVREMFPLDGGGYVADTPGLKALALWDIGPEELDGYFREISPLVAHCQFNDCTHRQEPGCAVLSAVAEGRIHPQRYRSYLRMRYGDELEDEDNEDNTPD